ncbi:MAG: hypothetical protein QOF33_2334 [Thermomicrobiales bacterium]|jgi:hypothetical protein|nr:hypothetical protein [Thermomicrobiales bacterium]MEA2584249.1 hypothetical protein [Thermomicrobiales bacterium]
MSSGPSRPVTAPSRVEGIAETVAEEVEGENGQGEGGSGEDEHVGQGVRVVVRLAIPTLP